MIVTCERCDTRFQLDDLRVPASGARVRCSRCKHAFVLLPAGERTGDAVHAIAEAAAQAEEPTPPSVTEDLVAPAPAADEDAEWQFADVQADDRVRSAVAEPEADPWAGILDEEKPPEARELDTLGSPETWSFVSEEAAPLQPPRPRVVAVGRVRAPSPAAAEVPAEVATPRSRAFESAGWVATALLLLAVGHGIDWAGSPPPSAQRVALEGGLVVEDLAVRRLENRVLGPVLVVGGTVVNPGGAAAAEPARLAVRVVGPHGEAKVSGAHPRSGEALRESAQIAAGPDEPLHVTPLAPGARVAFEAVVADPPRGDARIELRLVRAPAAPSYAGEDEPRKEPARADASLPSPLPSSE
ncbi:MAG: zinc-ribbon domain-containing protein [Deltaproteobacteria bacterium]|nr:zinc-ribbon domain-containing protein [Deltaproteobacteria bacterium]